jgi:hypothetical protein
MKKQSVQVEPSKIPSEVDLRRYVNYWQRLLHLQQWDVRVRYAHVRELIADDGNVAWGRIAINENHFRASMLILHPDDFAGEDDHPNEEIETTVVHELLHLKHVGLRNNRGPEPASDIREEQIINEMARLLIYLNGRSK